MSKELPQLAQHPHPEARRIAESERLSAAGVVGAAVRISSRSGPGPRRTGLFPRFRLLGCHSAIDRLAASPCCWHKAPATVGTPVPSSPGRGGPVNAGRPPLRWLAVAAPDASMAHERRRRRHTSDGRVGRPSSSPRTRASSDSALPAAARRPGGSANAHSVQPAPGPGHFAGRLTGQGEVFLLPADGHGHHAEDSRGYPAPNRPMAATLIISARTVETHVQHIMDKFGVSTRAQIAACSAAAPRPRGPAGPAAGGSAGDAGSAAPDHPAAGRPAAGNP
jgi:hypothetical protein